MSNRNFDSRVIIQRLQNQVYARNLYINNTAGQKLINNPQNSDGNASRFNSYVPGAQTEYFKGLIGGRETVSLGGTFGISSIPRYTNSIQTFSDPEMSNVWIKLGLDIDGEAADDRSGHSVSLSADGSTVAIGAYGSDGNGVNSGHVRVYKFINNGWTKLGLDIDGEAAADDSGRSVSISADGSTVAIGANSNDGIGLNSGHVRVYKFINNGWTKLGLDIDGEAADDNSGCSVSLSADGSTVAIGAWGNDGNVAVSGHVRVYKFINNGWTKLGLDIDGEAAGDISGTSVSLSADGSTVAIGARGNDGNGPDSGHVRVYKFINNGWVQLGLDIDGESSFDNSGHSVSLSADGSTVAIGAYGSDGNGVNSGHVRVYKFINNGWVQLGLDIDGEASSDLSGYSVSLSADGSIVAIGTPLNAAGYVKVYKFINNGWVQLGLDIDGEAIGDGYGVSVSLSADGSTVAIGASFNSENEYFSGHVRVYKNYNSV
jgi:phage gp36-like protein